MLIFVSPMFEIKFLNVNMMQTNIRTAYHHENSPWYLLFLQTARRIQSYVCKNYHIQ
jgi:hypothetical protein